MEKNNPIKYLIIFAILSALNFLLYSFDHSLLYFVLILEILWLIGLLIHLFYKKFFKIYLVLSLIATIGIFCTWFFVLKLPATDWYKNFTAKKGKPITASDIVKDFQANEDSAFAKYSDKQIEVTGVVKESKIENGKTAVMLQSADSTIGVYFVLKDSIEPIKAGIETTIKGMCTGYLGDVQFNEGIIIKK